jgi:hypothetical protein
MSRYFQLLTNGDGWTNWETPSKRRLKLACCTCGSVHEIDFRILRVVRRLGKGWFRGQLVRGHKVQMRLRDNPRATGQVRRHMKKEAAE